MREVDISLDLMKKDYKKRMDECEERRILFEGKQAKMREQVLKFEKFIQENDAKRLRADAKAKHERQLYAEKCKEMSALKSKIEELDKSRDELVIELGELADLFSRDLSPGFPSHKNFRPLFYAVFDCAIHHSCLFD